MSTALFYGSADDGVIYRAEIGYQDGDVPVKGLILPPPAEPAGIHGDASFGPLWLTLVWTAAGKVTVTPVVSRIDTDGVMTDTELTDEAVEIELDTQPEPVRQTFKVDFRESLSEDGAEFARVAIRGQRCSFKIEIEREQAGLLMVAGFALGADLHTDQLVPVNVDTGE